MVVSFKSFLLICMSRNILGMIFGKLKGFIMQFFFMLEFLFPLCTCTYKAGKKVKWKVVNRNFFSQVHNGRVHIFFDGACLENLPRRWPQRAREDEVPKNHSTNQHFLWWRLRHTWCRLFLQYWWGKNDCYFLVWIQELHWKKTWQ